ncbi:MAG TPA: ATP-binding protein, partial [Longimicrobiaceae bacterium]|nr:ATP-binding protein [Longimicrobiaceae bacterium]
SVANYRGARAAFETLNRGQIEILDNALRQALMADPDDATALQQAIVQNEAAGLRYVALMDGAGAIVTEAGDRAGPIVLPPNFIQSARETGIVTVEVDGRVRAFMPRFNDPRRGGGPGSGFGGGGPGRGGQPDGAARTPAFGHTLIEFEPVVAAQLMNRAGRSLALGSLAAVLLSVVAAGFWRQSVRHERDRIAFEQSRRLSQLGEMSAVLAHEIRNPLASLKGNAQLLAERMPEGTRDRAKADRVVSEATRLEALTTDLLEFARSGPNEPLPSAPADLAREAIEEVGSGNIILDDAQAPAGWLFDRERLRHALVNILRNAVQASPGRAPVLRIAEEADSLVFEVRDFGDGLPPGAEERLFDPFFTTRTNGTGLGLAVARRAVESHGGRIEASNHPAGGALFRILLPAEPS